MGKLFSLEDFGDTAEADIAVEPQDVFEKVDTEIGDFTDNMEVATERLTTASNDINLVMGMSSSMKGKKVASVDYFTSMENYRPVLENIAKNLGVKCRVPSLEDFKNPHGTQASHEIAMEGFFDYLKKLWDKVKDIFAAFFKKIGVFFRRLFNAELELDTYEEYLEGMVAKIKAKKMTISDNKIVLDSKLPTLLANPGMEAVDSDFILVTGESKVRQLVAVANTTFQTALAKISKEDLKELYKVVKETIDDGLHQNRAPDEVGQALDQIRLAALSGMNQLFGYSVTDVRQVPEMVYNAMYQHFDRSEIEDLRIHSLVDNNNYSEALPKNFNAFYVLSESGKIYVSSSTETNGYVQNKLFPISNANNLVRFYDFYKKISKELNMKRIDNTIGEFQDRVDDIVGLMKSRYVELLERLQKSKVHAREGERINTKEEGINALVNMFREIDRRDPNNPSLNRLVIATANELDIHWQDVENLIRDTEVEPSRAHLMMSIRNEEQFVTDVRKVLINQGVQTTSQPEMTREELEKLVKEYEQFQKFLLNYLNSLQVMLKDVSVNLAGTFTELRFELVKYIYNSAKLYVA